MREGGEPCHLRVHAARHPARLENTDSETGSVLFLYTPAAAGSLIEELPKRHSTGDEPVTAWTGR